MKYGTDIFSLHGKVALITGATGYLGTQMALSLAEAGAHVLVNSKVKSKAAVLVQTILDRGLSAEVAVFDVSSSEDIQDFAATRSGEPLDILINNAYGGTGGDIQSSTSNDYLNSYEVSVVATSLLFKSLLPSFRLAVKNNSDASIINVASMYGLVSPYQYLYASVEETNPPFYGAAKAALIQWTRYAACEFGSEGIRLNSISPGPFPSTSVQEVSPDFVEKLTQKVPLGRIGQSHEVRGVVLFLASSASSYVTGSNVGIDGGWTAW